MKAMAMGIMMIAVILACQNTATTQQQDTYSIKKQEDQQIARASANQKPALPPIDAAAPTQTETATFALG